MRYSLAVGAALFATALAALPVPQGKTLMEQGRYDEAKRILSPLTTDAAAIALLGEIAITQGEPEKAQQYLEKAISLKPSVAEYHFHLGEALGQVAMKASVFKQAVTAGKTRDEFQKAVSLDPNHIESRFGLIDFYTIAPGFMGGSQEKALQQAGEIRKRDSYMGHRAYARIYTRQKKADLARKEWQDFVREQPKSPNAHSIYGLHLVLTDKKIKEGFEELDLALRLDPGYMPAHYRLGLAAATSGAQLARGEEALRKYLSYKPSPLEPQIPFTHYFLGMILEKQGRKAEAKQSYMTALKLAPSAKQITEALKRVS